MTNIVNFLLQSRLPQPASGPKALASVHDGDGATGRPVAQLGLWARFEAENVRFDMKQTSLARQLAED